MIYVITQSLSHNRYHTIVNTYIMASLYTVAFVGLPSSGKSTIINSLVHKRLADTGICRTTTEYKIISKKVTDDDGNTFAVMDLPGMCDSEEVDDTKFHDMTYQHITDANLIFWVSDVSKAFITTHEVTEFNKLQAHLAAQSAESGKLYDICIILSKCAEKCDGNPDTIPDQSSADTPNSAINTTDSNSDSDTEEITRPCEHTGIGDIVNKVRSKFAAIPIKIFNAYGRCYHHPKSSPNLQRFIKSQSGAPPSNNNTEFSITEFAKSYKTRATTHKDNTFISHFETFLTIEHATHNSDTAKLTAINTAFSKITQSFTAMSSEKQQKFATKFCVTTYNDYYGTFLFALFLSNNHAECVSATLLYNTIIQFLIKVLRNGHYKMSENLGFAFSDERDVCKTIKGYFDKMDENGRKMVYNHIMHIFSDRIRSDTESKFVTLLLYICDIQADKDCHDMIKRLYNKCVRELYDGYSCKLASHVNPTAMSTLNILHTWSYKHSCIAYPVRDAAKFTTTQDITQYLSQLEQLATNNYYILLNKIDATYVLLERLTPAQFATNDMRPYDFISTSTNPICKRIAITSAYKLLVPIILRQIFENIEHEINDNDIVAIMPISHRELLYADAK